MQASERIHSPLFRRVGTLALKYRFVVLGLNLAITGWLVTQLPRLVTDTSYKAMMVSGSDEARVQERLEDLFGVDALFMLVIEGDVFSRPYLEKLRAFTGELSALDLDLGSLGKRDLRDTSGRIVVRARDRQPERAPAQVTDGFGDSADEGWGDEAGGSIVDELVSILDVREVRGHDGSLRVRGLFEDWPVSDERLDEAKRFALSTKSMAGHVVGFEGRNSVVLLRTDFMDSEDSERVDLEIRRIGAKYEGPGFRVQYSGVPALSAELNRLLLSDLGKLNAIGFGLMVLIMGWLFRHPLGVIGPILVVCLATLWTMGAMAVTGSPMTVVSTITPSFLICVGIGDAVHMISVYRQNKAGGMSNHDAIVAAVAETGRPVTFTSLTTMAGLFSFRFASLDAIRDFGLFSGIGVLFALLQSLVFLPVLLSFAPKGRFGMRAGSVTERAATSRATRLLAYCNRLSQGAGRNRVLIACFTLIALAGFGAARVRVHHNPLDWLPPDGQARGAVAQLDDHVGGSADLLFMIEATPGRDLRDLETMRRLERLEAYALAYPGEADGVRIVKVTTGLLDVLRESNWALAEERPDALSIPDSQQGVVDLFTLFESAAPDDLRRVMTIDASTGLMVMRMRWVEATLYKDLDAYLQRGIREIMGDVARVTMTGSVYQSIQSDNAILDDLLSSFAVALVVITFLMMGVLGDFRLGLISMLPNMSPILLVLGMMGLFGIGLDMSNLMIASIGIGIAVDDTIHYLHHFKSYYRALGDRDAAIEAAYDRAGHAMINTSLILLAGFLVFGTSQMTNLHVFGQLIALTVVLALFADLVFTPALLRLFFPAKCSVPSLEAPAPRAS